METYLPIFLWNLDCDNRSVSPFWELLDLISKPEAAKLLDLRTTKDQEIDIEQIPCVYCGESYKEKGLERHYKSCKDGPKLKN